MRGMENRVKIHPTLKELAEEWCKWQCSILESYQKRKSLAILGGNSVLSVFFFFILGKDLNL
jgi:hypothetical protein